MCKLNALIKDKLQHHDQAISYEILPYVFSLSLRLCLLLSRMFLLGSSSPCGAGRSFIPNKTLLLSDPFRPDSPGFTAEKTTLKTALK